MNLQQYLKLKARVEKLQREQDRATGSLDTLKEKLRNEFGCESIKQAKQLLKKLEREEHEAETEFNRALKAFEQQWDNKL